MLVVLFSMSSEVFLFHISWLLHFKGSWTICLIFLPTSLWVTLLLEHWCLILSVITASSQEEGKRLNSCLSLEKDIGTLFLCYIIHTIIYGLNFAFIFRREMITAINYLAPCSVRSESLGFGSAYTIIINKVSFLCHWMDKTEVIFTSIFSLKKTPTNQRKPKQ